MSDQSTLQKSVTRVLLGVVLLSSVAALVLTGNSGTLRDGVSNRTIAKIGSKSISAQQFEMIYARRLAQTGLEDKVARQMGVPSMVLQSEIERETLLQAAQKMGIRISNAFVATELSKQLEQVQLSGTPREKLQTVLNQQQITEKELVDLMRGDFSINLLASAVTTGDLNVPAPLLVTAYQSDKQKRSAEIIPVTLELIKDKNQISDKEVEAYYNEHKQNYRTAEKRDIAILVLPQKLFVKEVTVSDADVKAYFDEHSDQFKGPERVRLAQAVFANEDDAKKAAKASSLKDAKGGQFLSADWYAKTSLPKEIAGELYPSTPKGIVGPIKTSLGWHVLSVDSYEAPKALAFDDVRKTIERQLKDEKIDTQMNEATTELDTMIADEASLQDIAAKYSLKTQNVSGLQASKIADQLKETKLPTATQQRVQEAVFVLQDDEVSPLMDTPDGDYVLVQVTNVVPSAVPALDKIRALVTADTHKSHDGKYLLQKTESLVGLFDAKNPAAFDKAIQEAGLAVKKIAPSTKAEIEKAYDKEMAELLFTLGPDNALSYVQDPGKVTLIRLTDIIQNTDKPDEKASETLRETVKTNMVQELQQQFIHAWQKDLNIKINMDLLQSAFGPQVQEK